MDIEANLRTYLGTRTPSGRYTSFDYCFNHFQRHRDRLSALGSPEGLELSCLHLGFYLASWGMFRGSSVLLRRSSGYYAPLVEVIASTPDEIWNIDAHSYSDGAIETILAVAEQIRASMPHGASDTLVTKVMLGVFGCVPAFDTYVRKGSGMASLRRASLLRIGAFYVANAEVIDSHLVPTIDFATGAPTEIRYTRAKVIDMIYFVEGGYVP